ncbi:hypothetical protein K8S19_05010 [bacterium]|nr:hypothetical protein [bacterium]
MKRNFFGVLFFNSTPFFLILSAAFLLAAGTGPASAAVSGNTAAAFAINSDSQMIESEGNTTGADAAQPRDKIVIFADRFIYHDDKERLKARGHVRVWYGNITLTAEEAESDLQTRWVNAQGNVVLIEADRKIRCARLDYDLETRSAKAQGILFATHPWYYQGESVEKDGEKSVVISKASFTTCNARYPHFHLTAERIDIILGESLTAHHAVLYIGTTPLFYLPWFRRSLEDGRPPFSIRVGYNNYEGFYVKLKFSYFLMSENYGAVLLDLMEKKGVGVGLENHHQYEWMGKGTGDFSMLYINDQDEGMERWTATLTNQHEFSKRDSLQMNFDYVTDHTFNRQFTTNLVDSFQQKSYLSYSHRGDRFYFSAGISNVEEYDYDLDKYLTSSRDLPVLTYSLSSRKIAQVISPIYFSMSSSLNREFQKIKSLKDVNSTDTSDDFYDLRYRYSDGFNVTPAFTETYAFPLRVPTQPSLSASISFPIRGVYKETFYPDEIIDAGTDQTQLDFSYTTSVSLINKWVNYRYSNPTYLMQSRLTHSFSRKFPLLEASDLQYAGVTGHKLSLATDYYVGSFFTLQASTGYSFLLDETYIDWKKRVDPISVNGRVTLFNTMNLSWQGQHDWLKERITSGFISTGMSGKKWDASVNGSYSYLGSSTQEHSIFTTLSAGYKPGLGLALRSGLQYDVVQNEFTNLSLSLSRDLHCWDMQSSFKIYKDGTYELGFGMNLKAFPEFKVGTGNADGLAVGN